ncbi:SUN domain-containing protein 1 isoform X9 [Gadus macrocephalus]|uniref:SUN domain-containing protein 1 isoform X9 n=1 Tax=Gadus macrocephalus TaxID=80720 RepID=UPI0028CB53D4|nr:SUN domain-containing protein 1 isoform X9 [Gadus macrocephalus]
MNTDDEEGTLECWGWTDLYWWAVLDEERSDQPERPCPRPPAAMSRRSLRIHTPPHERGSPYGSASFSLGVPPRSEQTPSIKNSSKSLRRPHLSVSCSQSLLQTPRRPSLHQQHLDSSLHSVASDASLISSMLDESSYQERTLMDSYWGLDDDEDPQDSTILLEHSTALSNSTLVGSGDGRCHSIPAQTQTSMVNGHPRRDYSLPAERKQGPSALHSSAKFPNPSSRLPVGPSSALYSGAQHQGTSVSPAATSPTSIIYCRDKSRKGKPGQVGSSVLRWLERGWYHTSSFMSLLKNFLLVWCLPNLFRIALLLLLLLLLSALLGWWDPRDVLSSMLPVDGSDWRDALPLTSFPGLAAMLKPPQEGSGQAAPSPPDQAGPSPLDRSTDLQVFTEPPPPYLLPPAMEEKDEAGEGEAASSGDSERLRLLEQSLAQLWEHVEDSGHRAERMHGEVLGLYQGLRRRQQQLVVVEPDQVEADRASLEPWLDGLLEDKLAEMKLRLDEDRLHREQTRKQYMAQQKSQAFRMAELEQLLQALTAKMEEVQQRQEAVATTTTTLRPTSASRQQTSVSGVDSEFHDALRSDVSRLETALGDVRQDLNGLRGCQDHCHRLDNIQETLFSQVRAQVREELRALLYGNQLVSLSQTDSPDDGADDPAALPDSLLEWLAERYVSGADLRASLASLELSILRNVSKQLEQRRGEQVDEEEEEEEDDHNQRQTVVTQTVVDSLNAAGAGVTEEEVQLMVRNALRLYSQDRTGLADYALESGGGSILSTRCSETYETRTALLSLFGLPLWYFSQSPRVVIQPDVQPGNCWAFRGSTGYLVIRLSMKVQPTAFTLEHIPKALAPSGALRSAPRDFTVYGLDDEGQEEGQLLGSYSYEEDGEAVQTYHVTEEKEQAFQIIEVRILSNWGNQEYTCMYRLRVHGIPSND